MEPRTVDYIVQACQGRLLKGSAGFRISQISTDSRAIQEGGVFFALRGERFDGHNFLLDALAKGAKGIVVQRAITQEISEKAEIVIMVDDVILALGRLATYYCRDFKPLMIAVAGSNGKTTTKELIGSVLMQSGSTLRNEASFNNHIGVPLTLLQLNSTHRNAVLEIGSNHPGELNPLIQMISPRIGVITSIGREHLEFFKNLDGVALEEGSLAEQLPEGGSLFVNGDSPRMHLVVSRARCKVQTVGFSGGNDWRVTRHSVLSDGVEFEVASPKTGYDGTYRIGLLGRHQITNALLAIAVGAELEIRVDQIRKGLMMCAPPKSRMNRRSSGGVEIIDDCYNANVDSMIAALDALKMLPCNGRRVAVLGDMAELGDTSEAAHGEVGHYTGLSNVDVLFAVGKWAHHMGARAREAGVRDVRCHADLLPAIPEIQQFLRQGDIVLLKASHAMQMERLSRQLERPLVANQI